ncbi:PilW family protein [Marinimicrobium sp. ABcell2]|uniref:PilW family protein n=1 Tax=Marinimicrobium sp. ABcell2 TaxID=3069751 RepID=UPI0027AF8DD5|nr:PilW family protein [Marinimicrobium sp. ABcell2]MDQ2075643.1 PilW family protein [Marinimicrobium sp. ABcell2]
MINFKARAQLNTSSGIAAKVQRGFSLIEMMVAITLGLVLTTGILQLFLNTSRNNDELAKTSALIENGRFAIQLLQTDLTHGGFWDTHVPQFDDLTWEEVPTDVPTAVPDPCLAYSESDWDADHKHNLLGIAVQLHQNVPGTCAGIINNRKADTDILVVRHAGATRCDPNVTGSCAANQLYFQASLCNDDTSPFKLVDDVSELDLRVRTCTDFATARRFVSHIYYIRDYAITEGDGIPTLMRSQFGHNAASGELTHLPAEALIEGIEDLKVELGIDHLSASGSSVNYDTAVNWPNPNNKVSPTNRGDGAPDGAFIRCATPCDEDQLTNVVAAKIYFLVRATQGTTGYTNTKKHVLGSTELGPFNDNFKRHVYSTSVRLINVSGRRETP